MTVHERSRQQMLATGARRRVERDLAPAGKDFTGAKAVEASGDRLSQRYGQVLKDYASGSFKKPHHA